MGFNKNQFIKQNFEHRTEAISVPALSEWFDKEEIPAWNVRNLTANEMSLCQESAAKNKNIFAVVEALASSNQAGKVDALRSLIGNTSDVTGDMAKRLEMLVFASVEPEIDMSISIKLAENFPVEFMLITNKITILTGLGASKVKPKASTETSLSETV